MKVTCIKQNSYVDGVTKQNVIIFKQGAEYKAWYQGEDVAVTNELGSKHLLGKVEGSFFNEYFKVIEEEKE